MSVSTHLSLILHPAEAALGAFLRHVPVPLTETEWLTVVTGLRRSLAHQYPDEREREGWLGRLLARLETDALGTLLARMGCTTADPVEVLANLLLDLGQDPQARRRRR